MFDFPDIDYKCESAIWTVNILTQYRLTMKDLQISIYEQIPFRL